MLRWLTASPGLSVLPMGLPITAGLGGVFAETVAVVLIGNARKSTCERSMVPLAELAPISEKVHAGKVFPVTDTTVAAVTAMAPPAG